MSHDGVMLHCWMSDITTLLGADWTFFLLCRLPLPSPKAGSETQLLKPFDTI